MARLRLAFMGTPDFALVCLQALAAAAHDIVAVYCQPPRPAGRGHKPRPCPVQAYAEAHGLELRMPVSLKDPVEQRAFADLALDAAVVAAYGLILPSPILAAPRLGCLNVHASLLPRWRGAAPIQRAILAGDAETGITIMQMDEGLDTGAMLLRESVPIGPGTTATGLHDDLAALGGRLIVEALEGLAAGSLAARPQPEAGVTYAAKLDRAEGRLDWRESAADLDRRRRAFADWPGAWFEAKGERIKVLDSRVVAAGLQPGAAPGTLLDDSLTIACGEDALRLLTVQRGGKKPMAAADFLRGFDLAKGAVLPVPKEAA